MDMWVSHAPRRGSCVLCTKEIVPGDEILIGQYKWKTVAGTRTKRTRSHFECWIIKAQTYLMDNPYTPTVKAGPGRPTRYTPEQAVNRKRLNTSITRWDTKQQDYINEGMWAMANKYRGMIEEARGKLVNMQ